MFCETGCFFEMIYIFFTPTKHFCKSHFFSLVLTKAAESQWGFIYIFARLLNYAYHLAPVLGKAHRAKWHLLKCFQGASHDRRAASHCAQLQGWPLVKVSAKITNVRSDWVQPVTDFIWLLHASNDLLQCRNRSGPGNTDGVCPVAGLMTCTWQQTLYTTSSISHHTQIFEK